MAIEHIYMAVTCLGSRPICASHPLWKGRSGISPSQNCKIRLCMV